MVQGWQHRGRSWRLVDFGDVRANDCLAVNQFMMIDGQHNTVTRIVGAIDLLPTLTSHVARARQNHLAHRPVAAHPSRAVNSREMCDGCAPYYPDNARLTLMKPLPNLLLVITGDQGCGDPSQLSEKSLVQDLNLNFSPTPASEPNSAVYCWN